MQLSGNNITLFWSAEMVLIFWLYQKLFIKLLKYSSALITVLAFISLLMDWQRVYLFNNNTLTVIANKGFITTIFCAASTAIMSFLMKKEADSFYAEGISNNFIKQFYTACSIILFFFAGLFEINFQFTHRYIDTGLQYMYAETYIAGYFLLMIFILRLLKISINIYVRIGIVLLICIYYTANIHNNYFIEKFLLEHDTLKAHYIAHCAGIIFMCYLLTQTVLYVKQNNKAFEKIITAFTWVIATIIIVF